MRGGKRARSGRKPSGKFGARSQSVTMRVSAQIKEEMATLRATGHIPAEILEAAIHKAYLEG